MQEGLTAPYFVVRLIMRDCDEIVKCAHEGANKQQEIRDLIRSHARPPKTQVVLTPEPHQCNFNLTSLFIYLILFYILNHIAPYFFNTICSMNLLVLFFYDVISLLRALKKITQDYKKKTSSKPPLI